MFNTLLLFILSLFLQTKQEQQQYTIKGYTQGTDYTIKYFADSAIIEKKSVEELLAKIDSSMSLYKPYSLINKFNQAEKGCVIDDQFKIVLKKSFQVYRETQGKFDVTVAPLVQAWGFGVTRVDHYPDSIEVNKLLKQVGMDRLILKGNFLAKKMPGVKVDLNGIAQGYSVDVIADFLNKKGIQSYLVEIGGELYIKGLKPDGSIRRIGIEGPSPNIGEEPGIRHIIAIEKGAITTSGNYRKFHQRGTDKIAHLINPKTGYPLKNQMISVTVWAKDAITADAYDNALMAMEVNEALHFAAKRKNMEVYLVYQRKDGRITDTLSKGFKKMIMN